MLCDTILCTFLFFFVFFDFLVISYYNVFYGVSLSCVFVFVITWFFCCVLVCRYCKLLVVVYVFLIVLCCSVVFVLLFVFFFYFYCLCVLVLFFSVF